VNILEQQYPQFQIISAAKTGSTSMYSYLCQHPSIQCLAKKKETNLLRSKEMLSLVEKVYFQTFTSIKFLFLERRDERKL